MTTEERREGATGTVASRWAGASLLVLGSFRLAVILWSVAVAGVAATGQADIVILEGHQRVLTCMAFSPDGKHVVTGSMDGTLRIWNVNGAGKPTVLAFPGWEVPSEIAFSPDGSKILTPCCNRVLVWDVSRRSDPVVRRLEHPNRVTYAVYRPDGAAILTACADGHLRLWRSDDDAEPTILPKADMKRSYPGRVMFSPDDKWILALEAGWSGRPAVHLWNGAGKGEPRTLVGLDGVTGFIGASPYFIRSVEFSRNGDRVLGLSLQGASLWSLTNANAKASLLKEPKLEAARFTANGTRILTFDSLGHIRRWNPDGTGRELVAVLPIKNLDQLLLNQDGRQAITSEWRSRQEGLLSARLRAYSVVRLWHLDGSRGPRSIRGLGGETFGHFGAVSNLLVGPDGKYLLTVGNDDYTARVWRIDAFAGQQHFQGGSSEDLVVELAVHGRRFHCAVAGRPCGAVPDCGDRVAALIEESAIAKHRASAVVFQSYDGCPADFTRRVIASCVRSRIPRLVVNERGIPMTKEERRKAVGGLLDQVDEEDLIEEMERDFEAADAKEKLPRSKRQAGFLQGDPPMQSPRILKLVLRVDGGRCLLTHSGEVRGGALKTVEPLLNELKTKAQAAEKRNRQTAPETWKHALIDVGPGVPQDTVVGVAEAVVRFGAVHVGFIWGDE